MSHTARCLNRNGNCGCPDMQKPDPEHDSLYQRFEQLDLLLFRIRLVTEDTKLVDDANRLVELIRAQVLK